MEKLKVLTIDDDLNNLYALECILEQLDGVEVIQASSGIEALKLIENLNIHLILVDIQMPHMNGFEFVNELREREMAQEIPVVFLTAYYKSEEFESRGYKLGAFDYLTKPIDEDRLLNKVMLYNKLHQKSEELKDANKELEKILEQKKSEAKKVA